MIKNSEDANKYYKLVNTYIDEYTEKHKIKAVNLGKYLKNNVKLINFMERKGLKDIKNINKVITDVIEDRISIEKDTIQKFESFKFFESDQFIISDLKECLYKGIDKSNINHEKILADHFDTSLSHINIINSDKHIFKIDNTEYIIYTDVELDIIKENIIQYCFNKVFDKSIKLDKIDINLNIKNFIDKDKFNLHINEVLNKVVIKDTICSILDCKLEVTDTNFISKFM